MSQDPARDAVSRGDWQKAYDLLVEADARSCALPPPERARISGGTTRNNEHMRSHCLRRRGWATAASR